MITGILAALNNIEYANIYEWTHFGKPDNKTNFMTCHVSGPKPKDWIQIWHDIFDWIKTKIDCYFWFCEKIVLTLNDAGFLVS